MLKHLVVVTKCPGAREGASVGVRTRPRELSDTVRVRGVTAECAQLPKKNGRTWHSATLVSDLLREEQQASMNRSLYGAFLAWWVVEAVRATLPPSARARTTRVRSARARRMRAAEQRRKQRRERAWPWAFYAAGVWEAVLWSEAGRELGRTSFEVSAG
jgi:hypothetical protein